MKRVGLGLRLLVVDQRGATAVEYGLILALIFLAMLGGLVAMADGNTHLWQSFTGKIVTATGG